MQISALLFVALASSVAANANDDLKTHVRGALRVGAQCGPGVQDTAIHARNGEADAKSLLAAKCAKCAPHCRKSKPSSAVKCERWNDYCQCEDNDDAVYGKKCPEGAGPENDNCGTCEKLRAKTEEVIYVICHRDNSHAFANCGATCRNCVDYW